MPTGLMVKILKIGPPPPLNVTHHISNLAHIRDLLRILNIYGMCKNSMMLVLNIFNYLFQSSAIHFVYLNVEEEKTVILYLIPVM